ncbi:hypothetical protein OHB00_20765 [Streptomyces sp. NBC_00631]|uniref:hypothetical protein n=1 Tax=Streptomyces sp. NBC_00631 TaxID=2975793 RepID=UPI0030DFB15F
MAAEGRPYGHTCDACRAGITGQLDTHHGGCGFLDGEAQLSKYRAVLDHTESCALGPSESHDFIQSLIQDI